MALTKWIWSSILCVKKQRLAIPCQRNQPCNAGGQSKSKVIKIIIESGLPTDDEIVKCCELYGFSGHWLFEDFNRLCRKGATPEAGKTDEITFAGSCAGKSIGRYTFLWVCRVAGKGRRNKAWLQFRRGKLYSSNDRFNRLLIPASFCENA